MILGVHPQRLIYQYQYVLTKCFSMFMEFSKESNRIHTFPTATTWQQRGKWTHQPHHAIVDNTDDSNLYHSYSVIPSLIYPE